MYLIDYHLHTEHSFDGDREHENSVDAICRAAIEKGFNEIAITDHHCVNVVAAGEWPAVDFTAERKEILEAKEKYKDKLTVLFGVELGQATQLPEDSLKLLNDNSFEFVIGSLHNNRGTVDPYYIDYSTVDRALLQKIWDNYFIETLEMVRWGEGIFSTVGHIGYPRRYFKANGFGDIADFASKQEILDEIFKAVIDAGLALEVNSSGYRQGLDNPLPPPDLIRRYIELGGELFTVGSDSHRISDFGKGIDKTLSMLSDLGVKYITTFRNMKPVMKKIN